ncbi:zinc ABC transporter ATP-binding protein AztA [Qaidamihabitans albus]|uniref:zinc ABC transporter ATP-binding protein AztA n=1 Tax=Qaidamihabitans albus TaxID=2795733 RepID=UPI0018F1E9A5|nr:zinc ABC transporter ATP-binding protein AztA [Qaidamihabitans albus]
MPHRHANAEVAIHDLTVRYGRHEVLRGLTARVPASAATAVVGPNGSGKSTLLGAIAGVVTPASGSVARHGTGRPAFVVQRSTVADALPITVRQTVAMGRWAHRGPWRRLTRKDRSVVEDTMARLGILDLAERQLGALSGGQRQRALVAQGLAQESDLLLLDEPAAGLDMTARRHIAEALADATARGVTVVHATHHLDDAMRAEHCLLLREGLLVAEGSPAGILRNRHGGCHVSVHAIKDGGEAVGDAGEAIGGLAKDAWDAIF